MSENEGARGWGRGSESAVIIKGGKKREGEEGEKEKKKKNRKDERKSGRRER